MNDVKAVSELSKAYADIRAEIAKVIVGQDRVIEHLLIALLSRGHCLLIGVPGLAKTGPWTNLKAFSPVATFSSMISVPVISLGIRSGVN